MPQVEQRPGKLDIGIVPGDDFTFNIHSSIDLSGYTLAATSPPIPPVAYCRISALGGSITVPTPRPPAAVARSK